MRNSVMFWGVILVILVSIIGGGGAAAVAVSTSDTQRGEELKAGQLPNNNTDLFKMPEGETDLYYWNSTAERNLQSGECDENNKCPTSPCCSRWGFCGSGPAWCDCDGCIKYKPKTVQCGLVNKRRIIGGSVVFPKRRYPWQVGIRIPSLATYNCGGSIINNRWILTAAHCIFTRSSINTCVRNYAKSEVKVWVGDHDQYSTTDDDSNTQIIYSINAMVKHPKFDCISPGSDAANYRKYDLALLQLTDTIPFNDIIRPICLPIDDSNSYVGKKGKVTGWGDISLNGRESKYLRELQVTIYDENQCGARVSMPDIKICAGGEICKGPYFGDSGGPLVVLENGKYIQVGVTSHVNANMCKSKDYPGVFVRVSKEIGWIQNVAGPYFSV